MDSGEETRRKQWTRILFDEDGLPWVSRMEWGWLLGWISAILFILGPLVGMYIGLWLKTKRLSSLVLFMYSALTILWFGLLFFPFPEHDNFFSLDALVVITFALWLAAAFMLRSEVMKYYSTREGIAFKLNPALTAIFSAWYVSGQLRADFPLNKSGNVGAGILKLVD